MDPKSRINGLCEATLLGWVDSEILVSASGTSCAFVFRTDERWKNEKHVEHHYVVVTNPSIMQFARTSCPIGTLLHIRGNIRYGKGTNKRTDILVRELRKLR